jgi:propanol-preferring alcohol dehydrogenase
MQLALPGPVDWQSRTQMDAPIPVPGAGDIRLRVRACGVCHTDLHIVEGDIAPAKLPNAGLQPTDDLLSRLRPERRRRRSR